jgi:hypothetical protein
MKQCQRTELAFLGGHQVNDRSKHSSDTPASLLAAYQINRARFPRDELLRHVGHWVAFSRDGKCLVDSHPTLEGLEAQLRAAGREPQDYVYESVPTDEWISSAAELS